MEDIEEVSNIFPDVRISIFTKHDNDLVDTLRTESYRICRELISPKYINNVFRKFHQGYLINNHLGKRLGFVIWKIFDEPSKCNDFANIRSMYIYLICARLTNEKVGRVLLDAVDSYCIKYNISTVRLEPANNDLIDVYEKYGYTKEMYNHKIYMVKAIKPPIIRNRFTRKIRHRNGVTID